MTRYQVVLVDDRALPSGLEYAFVRVEEGTYLFVKRSAVSMGPGRCSALTRAWETWQREPVPA